MSDLGLLLIIVAFALFNLAMGAIGMKRYYRDKSVCKDCLGQIENDGLCHECRASLWGEQSQSIKDFDRRLADFVLHHFDAIRAEERAKAEKMAEALRKCVIAVADLNTPRSLAEKLLREAIAAWEGAHHD